MNTKYALPLLLSLCTLAPGCTRDSNPSTESLRDPETSKAIKAELTRQPDTKMAVGTTAAFDVRIAPGDEKGITYDAKYTVLLRQKEGTWQEISNDERKLSGGGTTHTFEHKTTTPGRYKLELTLQRNGKTRVLESRSFEVYEEPIEAEFTRQPDAKMKAGDTARFDVHIAPGDEKGTYAAKYTVLLRQKEGTWQEISNDERKLSGGGTTHTFEHKTTTPGHYKLSLTLQRNGKTRVLKSQLFEACEPEVKVTPHIKCEIPAAIYDKKRILKGVFNLSLVCEPPDKNLTFRIIAFKAGCALGKLQFTTFIESPEPLEIGKQGTKFFPTPRDYPYGILFEPSDPRVLAGEHPFTLTLESSRGHRVDVSAPLKVRRKQAQISAALQYDDKSVMATVTIENMVPQLVEDGTLEPFKWTVVKQACSPAVSNFSVTNPRQDSKHPAKHYLEIKDIQLDLEAAQKAVLENKRPRLFVRLTIENQYKEKRGVMIDLLPYLYSQRFDGVYQILDGKGRDYSEFYEYMFNEYCSTKAVKDYSQGEGKQLAAISMMKNTLLHVPSGAWRTPKLPNRLKSLLSLFHPNNESASSAVRSAARLAVDHVIQHYIEGEGLDNKQHMQRVTKMSEVLKELYTDKEDPQPHALQFLLDLQAAYRSEQDIKAAFDQQKEILDLRCYYSLNNFPFPIPACLVAKLCRVYPTIYERNAQTYNQSIIELLEDKLMLDMINKAENKQYRSSKYALLELLEAVSKIAPCEAILKHLSISTLPVMPDYKDAREHPTQQIIEEYCQYRGGEEWLLTRFPEAVASIIFGYNHNLLSTILGLQLRYLVTARLPASQEELFIQEGQAILRTPPGADQREIVRWTQPEMIRYIQEICDEARKQSAAR